MLSTLKADVAAALQNDPAARSRAEVLLTYPGLHALMLHRVAHGFWKRRLHLMARTLSHQARFLTGVEIHPGAEIADGVFIDHGMGVVIGETAVIEAGCILYKGVVLGGTTLERRVRHPHLGKNVIVGSNACVLGAITVGDNARIGSGSVVISDVPPGATVVGVPGRIVKAKGPVDVLDHAALPDPVADVLRSLAHQQEMLVERLATLERKYRNVDEAESLEAREDDPRQRAGRIF
ncbi:MAG: serine O-acetyltransferase [Archangiaceae bacterium]|nr:serine O-acetyltransferase [Archangiaceae bacterium]